jgi:hypothetical protein
MIVPAVNPGRASARGRVDRRTPGAAGVAAAGLR